MRSLSTSNLIVKRLLDDWKLLLSIFVGIIIASSLVAGAPVYFRSLQRLGINTAIDRSSIYFLNLFTFAPHVPLDREGIEGSGRLFQDSIEKYISEIYRGHERYARSPTYIMGKSNAPLPSNSAEERVSRGYLQFLSNMERHVDFESGTMGHGHHLEGL